MKTKKAIKKGIKKDSPVVVVNENVSVKLGHKEFNHVPTEEQLLYFYSFKEKVTQKGKGVISKLHKELEKEWKRQCLNH